MKLIIELVKELFHRKRVSNSSIVLIIILASVYLVFDMLSILLLGDASEVIKIMILGILALWSIVLCLVIARLAK